MIHPTAIIDASARIAKGVQIGPYSVIGPRVEIGEDTWIGPHVVIQGPTKIGQRNRIFQFASIGEIPQDLKFYGEEVWLEIGDDNTIRECVTLNRGTGKGGGITSIGHRNLLMAYVHVAHDCRVGNDIIFSNNASLAGHVIVEDFVIFGGFSGVFQFCRVGQHSFICTNSVATKDVLPYTLVSGEIAKPHGLNKVGLKRRGFSEEVQRAILQAYRIIYRESLSTEDAITRLEKDYADVAEVRHLVTAMKNTTQGFCR